MKLMNGLAYATEVSEVRVYVTGPKRFFDKRPGLDALIAMDPVYETTNTNDISRLIESLMFDRDARGNPEYSSSEDGYTYHILLMDTNALRAMEFMAFVPEGGIYRDHVTMYPRAEAKSIFKNAKLVTWLKQWEKKRGQSGMALS
jgi:hypothetical protein